MRWPWPDLPKPPPGAHRKGLTEEQMQERRDARAEWAREVADAQLPGRRRSAESDPLVAGTNLAAKYVETASPLLGNLDPRAGAVADLTKSGLEASGAYLADKIAPDNVRAAAQEAYRKHIADVHERLAAEREHRQQRTRDDRGREL